MTISNERPRRYFTEQDARNLIGRRVQARVALSRYWLRDRGLWIDRGDRGTVTQFACGPEPTEFLVGVHWDDPRPSIPRRAGYPIDWYTEDEYRALLGVACRGYPAEDGRVPIEELVERHAHDTAKHQGNPA